MDRCPDCGGSGVLRTDAAGYRTCLTCVGQGTLPRFEVAGFSSALAAAEVHRRRLSAWSSAG